MALTTKLSYGDGSRCSFCTEWRQRVNRCRSRELLSFLGPVLKYYIEIDIVEGVSFSGL
jgi:hypothetical protein